MKTKDEAKKSFNWNFFALAVVGGVIAVATAVGVAVAVVVVGVVAVVTAGQSFAMQEQKMFFCFLDLFSLTVYS